MSGAIWYLLLIPVVPLSVWLGNLLLWYHWRDTGGLGHYSQREYDTGSRVAKMRGAP